MAAILERRAGYSLADQDVYLNAVGGINVDEPAADLTMALALASAVSERTLPHDLIVVGEVGLMGEVRSVPRLDVRLAEAARLGFRRALVPEAIHPVDFPLETECVPTLARALEVAGVD